MNAVRFIQKTGAPDFFAVVLNRPSTVILADMPGSELTEEAPRRQYIIVNRVFRLSENLLTGERSYVER